MSELGGSMAVWTSAAPAAAQIAVGGGILVAGVLEDFRAKKFRNWMFVAGALAGFAASFAFAGGEGLQNAALGFLAGLALMLPLALMGAVGAGDMKLLAAYGAAAGAGAAWQVGAFGFAWGAVFGVLQAALKGEASALFRNVGKVATERTAANVSLHKIPFAAALFVGWLTHLTYEGLV